MPPRWFVIFLYSLVLIAPAIAEDITTKRGEKFASVSVSRVEPDGVVFTHATGIIKIPFSELPEEYQKRFGNNKAKAEEFAAGVEEKRRALFEQVEHAKKEKLERTAKLATESEARRIERAKQKKAETRQAKAEQQAAKIAYAISHGEVIVGMTAKECTKSWGEPVSINETIAGSTVHQQWCYKNGYYLYVENGILTAIQTSVSR